MKIFFTWFLGFGLGCAIGAGALYYNPFISSEPPLPASDDWVLSYDFPSAGAAAFTHGSRIPYPREPAPIEELWEDTLKGIGFGLFSLHASDAPAPIAVATRISVPSARSDLLLHGPVLRDYWLLTVPGQGSLFLEIDSNVWRFLTKTLLPVRYFGRAWEGPTTYEPTSGPRADQSGRLLGASGLFKQRTGSVVEKYTLEDFSPGQERFTADLSMHFDQVALSSP